MPLEHTNDDMECELVDHMGNDTTVVNAARVSYNSGPLRTEEDNERLINYLAKHGHWSPFAHCFLQFRIKAPLFVARQLAKHQVGLSWNEVSRRYVDGVPEYWHPNFWRGRAKTNKQGSAGLIEHQNHAHDVLEDVHQLAHRSYMELISLGVAPEQARTVLPQTMMTEWFWSGSLYAFARVCRLRLEADAQPETRVVAGLIDDHCHQHFPTSWDALTTHN